MTAVLHSTIPSPFDVTPGPPSCRLDGPFNFPEHVTDLDTISLNAIEQDQCRQPSPASIFSIASAPQPRNDENISPLARFHKGQIQFRSISSQSPRASTAEIIKGIQKSRNFSFQPLTAKHHGELSLEREQITTRMEHAINSGQVTILDSLNGRPPFPIVPITAQPVVQQMRDHAKECLVSKVKPLNHSHHATRTPETGLVSRIRELRQESVGGGPERLEESPVSEQSLAHQQGPSDTSSAFIYSMKSASFTNASTSIFPKSSRFGRSTDSYVLHGSHRYSIDSERPLSSCSLDDAAMLRGFKRHQIIDEIIATEETYIADLKALVYLYSTLLVSASTIPNRMQSAIEKNITEILHLHETMLAKFHSARLRAAARRWADTVAPARLGRSRNPQFRHSDRAGHTRTLTMHQHTKSDDSADMHGQPVQFLMPAEPIDVHEITTIFRDTTAEFIAYEEYCANFDVIGHELQKQMPHVWPTFESGMESLARAVMALDHRSANERRGLTVSDLLIKPIQRLMKYPLLLEQLLSNTPVADAPGAHAELDSVLQNIRNVVHMVNLARDSQYTRLQIQRRRLLQDRLDLTRLGVSIEQFRSLGQIELCGILYVTYQTTTAVDGCYALCALLDEHFLVALPIGNTGQFEAMALIQISDIKIEASTDGKGLQSASSFFTWKTSFAYSGCYHELMFSACSRIEEDHWMAGLRGEFNPSTYQTFIAGAPIATSLAIDLRSIGVVFSSQKSLSRESSVQRAATVGGRPSISQVIIRNTHNAHGLQEYRSSATSTNVINRSQSHMNSKRIPVLEPKRSDRARLEHSIGDIWTRERLPFPGMVGSRGGQIIRASAGTLARKLSLASIHTPFNKGRTSSLSMASRKSSDIFNDAKSTFEVRRRDPVSIPSARIKPKDIPEVDDMRSVVGRMMGVTTPLLSGPPVTKDLVVGRSRKSRKPSLRNRSPTDSSAVFYEQPAQEITSPAIQTITGTDVEALLVTTGNGPGRRRKRWSNPMTRLREIGSEARNMLYLSSSGA